ncbi:MAG: winged helix-turn-helix domain-containing protein [Candidatus Jordarchaeales archaeon]
MKRNVQQGVSTRSKIIQALKAGPKTAREIADELGMNYSTVLRHLKLMEKEKIVFCERGVGFRWKLTGLGQQPLQQHQDSSEKTL